MEALVHRNDRAEAGQTSVERPERLVFDIETDGLVATKVHCIVIKEMGTGYVQTYAGDSLLWGVHRLAVADELIGHNIISFDIPSLQRCFPEFAPKGKITDTLVLSRLIRADLKNEDFEANWSDVQLLPKRLYGSHSLGAWGMRIGLFKGDYDGGWETLSQDMLDYCVQDVEVNHALLLHLNPDAYSQEAIDLAHRLATLCDQIGNYGWTFDMSKAVELYAELSERRGAIEANLQDLFEPWEIHEEFIPKVNNKKLGYTKGEPFTKVKVIQFNPNSRRHIERCLRAKYNWQPKLMTAQGHAQIDESVLAGLQYPEAQKLAEFFMVQKRIGQLAEGKQAWMKLQKNRKLTHQIVAQGTVTGRAAHRNCNLGQVPATRLPYGSQCRELFTTQPGYKLLGADLSGLELRCLAYYLDDANYTREVLEGDIHSVNQEAAGLPDRDSSKRFIYAYLYGAGASKIGEVVGGGLKEGKQLLANFNERMPALGRLRRAAEKAAERGYVKGLDGRHIKIRSQHKALNSLLQGAGATISAQWLLNIQQAITEAELDANIMAWVHDEVQIQIREKDAQHVGDIARRAAQAAGEKWFQGKIPIEAEWKLGQTWADTH